MSSPLNWMPLSRLGRQFTANLSALRRRDRALADQLADLFPSSRYQIATRADSLILGRSDSNGIQTLANPLPPEKAREIIRQLFPKSFYAAPLLIAGLDQGWLWKFVYELECACSTPPGMRLPIYLATGDVERLWIVLHFQNFEKLLADSRVQVITGSDAIPRLQEMLVADARIMPPQLAATVEPGLWPEGMNVTQLKQVADEAAAARLATFKAQFAERAKSLDLSAVAGKMRSGGLRIAGLTSCYTTFLQHSMRDWLAAFEKMGHVTRLFIERSPHETLPAAAYAEQCAEFDPDLIVVIDHCRGTLPGLPPRTPCVTWIQDRLPDLYRPEAGAMQAETDFVIGYGMQECTQKWGYPTERFMPAMVGVNEERFVATELSASQLAEYGCDVSFVSHASKPAEEIVREESERSGTAPIRNLLYDIYERLRAVYDAGRCLTDEPEINGIIDSALVDNRLGGDSAPLRQLVFHQLNNAFLRHQTIRWAVATGADVRLYGKGWEKHPEFSRFARGVADNQNQLSLIYQASRINLQVTPFGAAHQRLFEGLAAGGFFLFRAVTGEAIDVLKREIWKYSQRSGIQSGVELAMRGPNDPVYVWLMSQLQTLMGVNPIADPQWFFVGLKEAAMAGFSRCASTLWPEYERVAFGSKAELTEKLKFFLAAPDARRELSESMRGRVLQWHTYTAISRRMLSFVADNLERQKQPLALAA